MVISSVLPMSQLTGPKWPKCQDTLAVDAVGAAEIDETVPGLVSHVLGSLWELRHMNAEK